MKQATDWHISNSLKYCNARFDKLDINVTVRDGIISLGKPNSKQVPYSLTMSPFEVQNKFIKELQQQ